jgi:LmbE family N-acetylglucosaminyl deacetylase
MARHQAVGNSLVVATVFGGKPDYAHLSVFAQEIHGRPLAGVDPIETRWAENRKALEMLGAIDRTGDYLDCIYREDTARGAWLYTSEASLFGPVSTVERGLPYELAQALAAGAPPPEECRIYAPLAVGNHVDHQLVRKAAFLMHQQGFQVCFYEDYPYVVRDANALSAALALPRRMRWTAELIPLSDDHIQRKVDAISAYRSQIGVLFGVQDQGGPADVGPAVRSFAQQVAGIPKRQAERLWWPGPKPSG